MSQYTRAGIFTPEEVLAEIGPKVQIWGGKRVKMNSKRYHCFAKSLKCATCSLVGSIMALERDALLPEDEHSTYHFNLYAITRKGYEILMTKDHILPKSKGGKDNIENLQTMCAPCNRRKGDGTHQRSKSRRKKGFFPTPGRTYENMSRAVLYHGLIGYPVKKRSGKTFKGGLKIATPSSVIRHPIIPDRLCYTFEEFDAIVECWRCVPHDWSMNQG